MGRRPDPSASSESTLKRRKNTALVEVAPTMQLDAPPECLTPEAAEIWREVGRELIQSGILTMLDMGVLADYCTVAACLLEINREMQAARDRGESPFGTDDRMSPIALMQLKYIKQKDALAGELGLTPAGRTKVRAKSSETPTAAFDRFEAMAYG
jgi:P27 family predicted phage terminase small subunit